MLKARDVAIVCSEHPDNRHDPSGAPYLSVIQKGDQVRFIAKKARDTDASSVGINSRAMITTMSARATNELVRELS
jgi:hypothetical protein